LAIYYFVHSALLYYQNDTLYVDFPLSAHVSDMLAASTGLIGLLATKSLLRVGTLQRVQGHGVTAFIVGQFLAAIIGSFVIPEHMIARPLIVYGALFVSYLLLALTSFAQSYRDQPGSYRFAAAWGLVAVGLFTSMAGASGFFSAEGWVLAAYWYSLIPQGILLASATVGIILFEKNEDSARVVDEEQEHERLELFRQSKESTEINRLRKLIDHEREVMNELREREVRQNEEMRKAKDAADEANRAKSAFLAVISHEIRTPMTGIMGMVRLLQETSLSSEQREYSQTIQDSGDAMVSLLNDILDFEKIESGKMDLEHLDFDMPRLLTGVVTLMSGR
jgi:signal transduction histidine kinase